MNKKELILRNLLPTLLLVLVGIFPYAFLGKKYDGVVIQVIFSTNILYMNFWVVFVYLLTLTLAISLNFIKNEKIDLTIRSIIIISLISLFFLIFNLNHNIRILTLTIGFYLHIITLIYYIFVLIFSLRKHHLINLENRLE